MNDYKPSPVNAIGSYAHYVRSEEVARLIAAPYFDSKEVGLKILDFGMGSGETSITILNSLPCAHVFGFDEYKHNMLNELIEHPRFLQLQDYDQIKSVKYDHLVSVQVFEHLINPIDTVKELTEHITEDGSLVFQLPTPFFNPIDLVVYDHVAHYSINALIAHIPNNVSDAECRLYTSASVSNNKELLVSFSKNCSLLQKKHINSNLKPTYPLPHVSLIEFLQTLSNQVLAQPFDHAIFGSSYSSKWCSAIVGPDVPIFESSELDDSNRQKCFVMPFPRRQAQELAAKFYISKFISF